MTIEASWVGFEQDFFVSKWRTTRMVSIAAPPPEGHGVATQRFCSNTIGFVGSAQEWGWNYFQIQVFKDTNMVSST